MMEEKKRVKSFLNTFLSYMIILIITLSAVLSVHFSYSHTLITQTQKNLENTLTANISLIDKEISRIQDKVDSIFGNATIKQINDFTLPLSNKDFYFLSTLEDDSKENLWNKQPLDSELVLFFPQSEIILSPYIVSSRSQYAYSFLCGYNEVSYEEWIEEIREQTRYLSVWPSMSVSSRGQNKRYISLLFKEPGVYKRSDAMTAIILIPENNLLSMLDNSLVEYGGECTILDSDGTTILNKGYGAYASASNDTLDNHQKNDLLTVYEQSSQYGWRYVISLPSDSITKSVSEITNRVVFILIGCFAIAVIISLLLTKVQLKPVFSLLSILHVYNKQEDDDRNPYTYIQKSLNGLIDDNNTMKYTIGQLSVVMKEEFVRGLLHNAYTDENDMRNHMRLAGVEFTKAYTAVLLVKLVHIANVKSFDDLQEINDSYMILSNLMQSISPNGIFMLQQNEYEIATVISFDSCYEKQEQIDHALDTLQVMGNMIQIGIGQTCSDLLQLHQSYQEALYAMRSIRGKNERYAEYARDVAGAHNVYTLEQEKRVISLVLSGESEELKKQFDEMFGWLNESIAGSEAFYQKTVQQLLITIERILILFQEEDKDFVSQMEETIENTHRSKSPVQSFERCKSALLTITIYLSEKEKEAATGRAMEIISYTDENFCDPSLCAQKIAEHFGVSEKFIWRIFKDYAHDSIASYIEKKRMSFAKEMLQDETKTISEVSLAAGYQNENTFYKAFKRFYGVSPRKITPFS